MRVEGTDLTLEYTARGVKDAGSSSGGRSPKMFGWRFMMCFRAPYPEPAVNRVG